SRQLSRKTSGARNVEAVERWSRNLALRQVMSTNRRRCLESPVSIDKLEKNMKQLFFVAAASAALVLAAFGFQAQNRPQQAPPNADPYANNAAPGTTQFPLAAPAGKASGASDHPLPGRVTQCRGDQKAG